MKLSEAITQGTAMKTEAEIMNQFKNLYEISINPIDMEIYHTIAVDMSLLAWVLNSTVDDLLAQIERDITT